MNYWLTFFTILIYSYSLNSTSGNLIDYEYHILEELYNTTNGDSWTFKEDTATYGNKWNFNGSSDPCNNNWQGITCQSVQGIDYVQNITLPQYNLKGPLIESIGNLKYLYFLHLARNSLYGTLPKNLANSSTLVYLRLHDNKFQGQIPAEYGNFTSLINMWFDRNQLTGTIPPEIANLPKAAWIDFGFNKIKGKIPESIAHMKALNNLQFNFNYLTGTIPEILANLTDLYEFQVDTNYLTGTIPASFGNLTKLIHLYFDTNLLHGAIPKSFSQLKNLKLLSIGHNQLSGPFPDVFGEMESLQYLLLENNYFSSTLPESLYTLTNLKMIDFHKNLLSGPLTSSIGKLINLNQFQIAHNSITGVIPEEVGTMTSLKFFFVYYNSLIGSIPSSLVTISTLQELYIYNNMFTGSIPSDISTASNLVSLLVHHNKLTGHLQDCFNSTIQTKLKTVELSSNRFQGNVPKSLFLIHSLEVVDLTENCFKGSIPSSICIESSNLVSLYAEGLQSASNCERDDMGDTYLVKDPIYSDIPECIFNLTKLMVLYLSGNSLTGSISNSLALGPSLSWLSLAHNQLTGDIPKSIQKRRWTKLDLSHNRFSGTLKSNFASEPTDFTLTNPFPDILQSYIVSLERQYLLSYTVLNLQSNRLSGYIPSSFSRNTRNITNLQILRNNLFTCDEDRDDLPDDDPDSDEYQCGSQSFNAIYYTWLVGSFLLILGAILISYNCIAPQIQHYLKQWDQFNSNDFSRVCSSLQYISFWSTLYVLVILLPLYLILRHFYATHRYAYAWSVSSVYLTSGAAAGSILTFITIFMMTFILLNSYHMCQKVPINMKIEGPSLFVRIILFIIGLGVCIGMNILFLYLVIYKDESLTSFFQFLLALYMIFWNDYAYPKIIYLFVSLFGKNSMDESSLKNKLLWSLGNLQVYMQLFQYIIIPCIIVSVMSDNCFYNVFSSESKVATKSIVLTCTKVLEYFYFTFSKTGFCVYLPSEFDNSYVPSFNYSYQCSASFLVYYVPVFIYICIIVTFIIPLVQFLCYQLLPNRFFQILPNVLTKKNLIITDKNELKLKSYEYFFHPNQLIINILGYLSILLTFGAMYPPLAVAILLMIISLIISFKLKTSRFILDAIELKATFYIDIINEECDGILQYFMIDRIILWIYVVISFLFYILFIFDIDGDEVGINGAYWVLILVPLLSLILYILSFLMIKAGILPIKSSESDNTMENDNSTTTTTTTTTSANVLQASNTITDYEMSSVVKSPLVT